MYNIVKFISKKSKIPIDEFILKEIKNGNKKKVAKISAYITLLENFGNNILQESSELAKKIDDNLFELRPKSYRILYYYSEKNNEFVLLHAFIKKTRATPKKEIEKAKKEIAEYERMTGNESQKI